MTRASLILNLIRAGGTGDRALLEKTVHQLAAAERAKNHVPLAEQILAAFKHNGSGRPTRLAQLPKSRDDADQLVTDVVPVRRIEDLILLDEVENAVRELVEEQAKAELLRSHNLEPRSRVLLAGPPGNGKTTLAEAIAGAMDVPFLVVRYEGAIESLLGASAKNITKVFDYARSRPCVLFFDEFDAIGKERNDRHDVGEIKRLVSSLLLQMDALPSYVVIVAASNHPEMFDRAMWRRFQLRLELPMPKRRQIEQWLQRFEKRVEQGFGLTPSYLSHQLKGLSFAEVEDFGTDVMRRIALNPNADPKTIAEQRLDQWSKRFTLKDPQGVGRIGNNDGTSPRRTREVPSDFRQNPQRSLSMS